MSRSLIAAVTARSSPGLRVAIAVRTGLAFGSALFVGLAVGEFELGVAAAFGALGVGLGDTGGSGRSRYLLLSVMALWAGVCASLGSVLGNVIVVGALGMFLIAFTAAMSQAVSPRLYGVLFGAEMLYLVRVASPEAFGDALTFGLGVAVGGLWSALLLVAFQAFDRVGPARRDLAAAYRAAAATVRATPADPDAYTRAGAAAGRAIEGAIAGLRPTETPDLAALAGGARRLWIDTAGLHAATKKAGSAAASVEIEDLAVRIEAVAESLDGRSPTGRPPAAGVTATGGGSGGDLAPSVSSALGVIRDDLARLGYGATAELFDEERDRLITFAFPDSTTASSQQRLADGVSNAWGAMKRNLTPTSLAYRHALRVALLASLTIPLYRSLDLPQGAWLTITVVVVLQADFGATFTKGLQRILGTLIGVAIAGGLGWLTHGDLWALAALMTVLAAIAVALMFYGYFFYMWVMTPLMVLMATISGLGELQAGELRGLFTAAAGVAAITAAYYLWPGWQLVNPVGRLRQAIDRLREFTDIVLDGYEHPPPDRQNLGSGTRSVGVALTDTQVELDRFATLPPAERNGEDAISVTLQHARQSFELLVALSRALVHQPPPPLDLHAYRRSVTDLLDVAATDTAASADVTSAPAPLPATVPDFVRPAFAAFQREVAALAAVQPGVSAGRLDQGSTR